MTSFIKMTYKEVLMTAAINSTRLQIQDKNGSLISRWIGKISRSSKNSTWMIKHPIAYRPTPKIAPPFQIDKSHQSQEFQKEPTIITILGIHTPEYLTK